MKPNRMMLLAGLCVLFVGGVWGIEVLTNSVVPKIADAGAVESVVPATIESDADLSDQMIEPPIQTKAAGPVENVGGFSAEQLDIQQSDFESLMIDDASVVSDFINDEPIVIVSNPYEASLSSSTGGYSASSGGESVASSGASVSSSAVASDGSSSGGGGGGGGGGGASSGGGGDTTSDSDEGDTPVDSVDSPATTTEPGMFIGPVKFPGWIAKDKIRGGYIFSSDDRRYASIMKNNGLNTLILKGEFRIKRKFEKTLQDCRLWAKTCKDQGMHLFVAFNWQPDSVSYNDTYRRVIYSDGKTGILPCPRDKDFWEEYMTKIGLAVAELSLDEQIQIDGLLIDMEEYGSRALGLTRYGSETCFCDNCFSEYLLSKGYRGEDLPRVSLARRKRWLEYKGLLDGYYSFIENEVELLASTYENAMHQINPDFLIGVYPTPRHSVSKSSCRGFGTADWPMVVFGTDSYESGGASKIPERVRSYYLKQGIHAVYSAGYLFRCYSSYEMNRELPLASKKCSGYWLYHLGMLFGQSRESEDLKNGSSIQYQISIRNANRNITGN